MFLELYHGRTDPDQDMDEVEGGWGSQGPIFEMKHFHLTYLGNFRLMGAQCVDAVKDDVFLTVFDDMIFYDGVFYGDLTVFDFETEPPERAEEAHDVVIAYDETKAKLPEKYIKIAQEKARAADASRIKSMMDKLTKAKEEFEAHLAFYKQAHGVDFDYDKA